jgi:hypothetical protein
MALVSFRAARADRFVSGSKAEKLRSGAPRLGSFSSPTFGGEHGNMPQNLRIPDIGRSAK